MTDSFHANLLMRIWSGLLLLLHRPVITLLLLLAGCSSGKNDLAFTRASDPVWAVNPNQWPGPAPVQSTHRAQGN